MNGPGTDPMRRAGIALNSVANLSRHLAALAFPLAMYR